MTSTHRAELERLYDAFKDHPRGKPARIRYMDWTLETPDALSCLYQLKEIVVQGVYDFPCSRRDPVIIDCGANIGVSALHLAARHPEAKLLLFEADPRIAGYLERNLAANGLAHVPVVRKAVWVHGDGVDFVPEGAEGGSVLGVGQGLRVESVRLRGVLERLGRVDFLKMDIEGAEAEVLADCAGQLGKVGFAFVECHCWRHLPQNLHTVLALLAEGGFRYYLENIWPGSEPYVSGGGGRTMDVQVNVWARRPVPVPAPAQPESHPSNHEGGGDAGA